MPQIKSAQKEVRATKKRRLRNQTIQSQCKSRITKAENLILSGELEPGQEAVASAISTLDKAAEKGIIHPNNAARRKSRLLKKLNEAKAKTADEA
ncbi:30S ribosomal protein S20 [Chloroflexota bacterium]